MNSLRTDLKVICDIVKTDAKVLDIGCGDGELLKALKAEKNVSGRGIELDQANVSVPEFKNTLQGYLENIAREAGI